MNAQAQEKPVYVTPGFVEKFAIITADENVSFKDIGQMLVYQPYLVAHLLQEANRYCDEYGSSAKPKSIQGIINGLGLVRTISECFTAQCIPRGKQSVFCAQTIDTYSLAVVLAELAEKKLGRKDTARDFFFVGLISPVVAQNSLILDSCHEELLQHFSGETPKGHPTLLEALELIGTFRKNPQADHGYIFAKWKSSRERAREAIDELAKF